MRTYVSPTRRITLAPIARYGATQGILLGRGAGVAVDDDVQGLLVVF